VVGHLKQYRWIDSDGKQHSKIGIVADHVEFRTEPAKKDEEENPDYMNEYIQEETIPFDEIEKSRQQRAGK
jgi:single-strand DNA-binding protein